jgi:hypothetical protein
MLTSRSSRRSPGAASHPFPTGRPGLLQRRRVIIAAGAALMPSWAIGQASATPPLVEVWKGPTCGCCNDWIKHLQAHGFQVKAYDTGNAEVRSRLGMPTQYGSCHTARVDGYVVEGHVPAREIRRLLAQRPQAVGLAVPAMPVGSPGMDGPEYRGRKDPYDVLLVRADGSSSVYHAYR